MESILLEDNRHWVSDNVYNSFIDRRVLKKALKLLQTKEILAVLGARRVGKSTLVKLIIRSLLKEVNPKNIFFINLEKPEFIQYKSDPVYLEKIYESYLKFANPNRDQKIYFFIDEIQTFHNWEVFIKSKYENSNIKFIITGSNSSLLESNYATVLTGRVIKLQIYPFNFLEYLDYKNILYNTKLEQLTNKIDIEIAKDEYLKWGGYFSVISNSDEMIKKEYLKNIAEDIILKDIVPRYRIKNSSEIKDMFFYLVSNATTYINYSKLSKKIGIDAKMIKEYIEYFKDNYLISTINQYHTKLSSQIKSTKKLYLNDNGFLNLGVNRAKNRGILLENFVFNLLTQAFGETTYLKDKQEIDFFIDNLLIQVSFDIEDEKTKAREISAFNNYRGKKILITYDKNEILDDVEIISVENFIFKYCIDFL
ncbi:MAG: ATP-binding protein [Epsilonproteobacteria bacterium]|nr:ATP-binding protein [Campylobacterota bacterium]